MTEAEWLACNNLRAMENLLGARLSERKSRLFAVAACRLIWHLIPIEESRRCVEIAERYADGTANDAELEAAIAASMRACDLDAQERRRVGQPWERVEVEAINAVGRVHRTRPTGRDGTVRGVCAALALERFWNENRPDASDELLSRPIALKEETGLARLAGVLRELFGNPFRPVTFNSAWRTSDVMLLAHGIYDAKAFDRMPILADALQDAGCDNDDILSHCRDTSLTHVRGCWVVDQVLGKE